MEFSHTLLRPVERSATPFRESRNRFPAPVGSSVFGFPLPISGIMKPLWRSESGGRSWHSSQAASNRVSLMKPLELALTPTRNRRLNEVTGMVLLVAASLLFLALASYRPTDPSFNTVGAAGRQVHNWTGLIGASLSDILLQLEGVAAFMVPLLLGALGWTWLRSRPAGSPAAKVSGVLLYLVFAPAIFGLIPGHLRWMHALPLEGLTGRLVVDTLVHYLNFPGAAIVIVSMVVIALYLSTTFSFSTAQQWLAIRFAFALAWRDRIRNWRTSWARARAERSAVKRAAQRDSALIKAQKSAEKTAGKQAQRVEDEERIPTSRRAAFSDASAEPRPHTPSLWNQMPRTSIPDRERTRSRWNRKQKRSQPWSRRQPWPRRRVPRHSPLLIGATRHLGKGTRRCGCPAGHPGPPRRQRLPAAAEHTAAPQRRVADRARRRSAQPGPHPGREMRGVRRTRPGGADQSRPGGHHLRVPARSRSQVQPRDRPGGGSMPGDARGEHSDRAHGGQRAPWASRCRITTAKPSGCAT